MARLQKNRRGAIRPVEGEVVGILTLLGVARGQSALLGILPEPTEWQKHADVLQRELSKRKWDGVVAAYHWYDTLRTLAKTLHEGRTEELDGALDPTLRTTIGAMEAAGRSLRSLRERRSIGRVSETFEGATANRDLDNH